MNQYTYTLLIIIFFTPVLAVVLSRGKKVLKKKRYMFYSILFSIISFFIVDPVATYWGAWGYDYEKTLGIFLGKSVFEELIWGILLCIVLSIVVASCAEKEERKKSFFK